MFSSLAWKAGKKAFDPVWGLVSLVCLHMCVSGLSVCFVSRCVCVCLRLCVPGVSACIVSRCVCVCVSDGVPAGSDTQRHSLQE